MGAYTTIDDSSEFFTTTLYTGTGANQDVVNDANFGNFKPDFLWIKNRGRAYGSHIYDSSRGAKGLHTDQAYGNDAEQTASGTVVQSFNTNGFRGGSSTNIYNIFWINGLNDTYVSWQWKINGGTTGNRTDANISSVNQVNTKMGMSILQYSGNGATGQSVKHGLGAIPEVFWVKRLNGGHGDWFVYHKRMGNTKHLHLNTTANAATTSDFGNYGPDANDIFVNNTGTCINGETYVAYCWTPIQGFSKFGSYEGTGNANGPFVATGFKPAFVMVKNIDNSGYDWAIMDSTRTPTNANGTYEWLWPNLTAAEFTDGDSGINMEIDFLSNGFKVRTARGELNLQSTFIYMAFAENPFVTSTGVPTTAR